MLTFSNPRQTAEFNNWPSGGNQVLCKFQVEQKKNQERVARSTTKNGVWCKPKFSTYADRMTIVDGSDGKTYILKQLIHYGWISVMRHDFMDQPNENNNGPLQAQKGQPLYDEWLNLINLAHSS